MAEQLRLPGFDTGLAAFEPAAISVTGRRARYSLFFALFFTPEDARQVASRAAELRRHLQLNGAPIAPDRTHVTLHALASQAVAIPQVMVDAAIAAANRVACTSFAVVFDRVLTFSGNNAFVMRCDEESDAAVARLRGLLTLELRRVRLRTAQSRTPHMTLLYDPQRIVETPISPIVSTATRFALILSHVGATHHQCIKEWALAEVN